MQPRDGVHGRGALFTTRLPEFPWPLSSVRCRLSSVPGLQSLIDIERTERRVRAVSGELINAVPWLVRVPAAGKSSSPRGTCAVARDKPPLLKYRLFNPAEPPRLPSAIPPRRLSFLSSLPDPSCTYTCCISASFIRFLL